MNIDRLVVDLFWLRICLLNLFLLDFFTQNIFLSVVFSPSVTITVFCMLIPSHKSPVVQDSAAQTADDKTSSVGSLGGWGVATPWDQQLKKKLLNKLRIIHSNKYIKFWNPKLHCYNHNLAITHNCMP